MKNSLVPIFVVLVVALTVNAAFGQTQINGCTDMTARRLSWASGSVVRVHYNGANVGQFGQLQSAVFSANVGNDAAGVDVMFSSSFGTGPTLTFTFGQNMPDPVSGIVEPAQLASSATDGQGNLISATIRFDLSVQRLDQNGQLTQALNEQTSNNIFTKAGLHEMGHTMGFGEGAVTSGQACGGQIAGTTVINGLCGANDWRGNMATTFTSCDQTRVAALPQYQPTPEEPEEGGCQLQMCEAGCSWDCNANGGAGGCVGSGCDSPIIADLLGDGIELTRALKSIFDINGDGTKDSTGWTTTGTSDAWLVLDRNNNKIIDNGKELFGNHTDQPTIPNRRRNGFLALAIYDSLLFGGNENGLIDKGDIVFASLQLWQDRNRNGISEAPELSPLISWGIGSIDLDYKESRQTDQFGNRFRYRTKVGDTKGSSLSRWVWDVFLTTQ